jgi:hypothetical protein
MEAMNYDKKYIHIEQLKAREVEGILEGECYIFPKLDGTNGVVWYEAGEIKAGSRNRVLEESNDNAGFLNTFVKENYRELQAYFNHYPNHVIYGEWLCLSGDTEIRLVSGGKRGHYMTLRDMYQYLNEDTTEVQSYTTKKGLKNSSSKRTSWWKRYGLPQTFSLFIDEDKIKPQRIANIIYTGDKEVYEVTTRKGKSIKSTLDHKFWTNKGWLSLKDLVVGDVVAISDLTNYRPHRRHGKGSRRITSLHKDLKVSNSCSLCGIDKCLEVHHVDGNWKNNEPSNLQVVCRDCHGTLHSNISCKNQEYDYEFDSIISINYIGVEDCYDISMGVGENSSSFIANSFVVHNCPHTIKTYREEAWRRFYIFDVMEDGKFISYKDYVQDLKSEGFDVIPPLVVIKNPTVEHLWKYVNENTYMLKDGQFLGEGIVIKRYNYVNPYGRTTWGKLIRPEFKDDHRELSNPNKIEVRDGIEQIFVNEFVTESYILKEQNKIINECGSFENKYIPRLLNTVYYEVLRDHLVDFVNRSNATINFKTLRSKVFEVVRKSL